MDIENVVTPVRTATIKKSTNNKYDPAIPLLGRHPKETRSETDTCTPTFTAALFTIARTRKQPRCPLADERIRQLWYIYNGILLKYKKERA